MATTGAKDKPFDNTDFFHRSELDSDLHSRIRKGVVSQAVKTRAVSELLPRPSIVETTAVS